MKNCHHKKRVNIFVLMSRALQSERSCLESRFHPLLAIPLGQKTQLLHGYKDNG